MLPPAREEGADEALEEDVPLEWVREYQYTLAKRDTSAQDTYYLAIGETVASYNPIESRIAMARKSYRTKSARPSPITFSRRTVNEDEAESQNQRRLLQRRRHDGAHQPRPLKNDCSVPRPAPPRPAPPHPGLNLARGGPAGRQIDSK